MKLVELSNVTRIFEPDFTALDGISLAFRRGEIHTILGENGAGKSTLVHILSGLLPPSSGSILIDGKEARFGSTRDALEAGIAMVHQRPLLSDDLSVLDNVILGCRDALINRRAMQKKIGAIAASWDISLDFASPARTLAPQDRLRTALLASLFREPSFLILDEPTAVLSPGERDDFMESLVRARSGGLGVIVITHKLNEAVRWSDRVSVLRRGALVFSSSVNEPEDALPVTADRLATFIAAQNGPDGVPVGMAARAQRVPAFQSAGDTARDTILSVTNLCATLPNRPAVSGITFRAEPGTITGIFGLPGSGIDVLEDMLSGMAETLAGTVSFTNGRTGRTVTLSGPAITPHRLRSAGQGFVPSDRTFRGSNPELAVRDILAAYRTGTKADGDRFVRETLREEGIDADPDRKARTLSGGQLQRVILARELAERPGVLLLAEPEWGLDIRSTERFRERLQSAAASGMTVIVLTDSPETMKKTELYDTVYHLEEGRLW